jgi:hypothetical protein
LLLLWLHWHRVLPIHLQGARPSFACWRKLELLAAAAAACRIAVTSAAFPGLFRLWLELLTVALLLVWLQQQVS